MGIIMIFSMILFLFSLLVSPGYFQYESMNLDVVERLAKAAEKLNAPIELNPCLATLIVRMLTSFLLMDNTAMCILRNVHIRSQDILFVLTTVSAQVEIAIHLHVPLDRILDLLK